MIEPFNVVLKCTDLLLAIAIKRTDVRFVNDELVPRRDFEVIILPIESGIMNKAIANRICDLAHTRVYAIERCFAISDCVPVLVTDGCILYHSIPAPTVLASHRICIRLPVIEIANHADRISVRCPDAKGCSSLESDRAHSMSYTLSFVSDGNL